MHRANRAILVGDMVEVRVVSVDGELVVERFQIENPAVAAGVDGDVVGDNVHVGDDRQLAVLQQDRPPRQFGREGDRRNAVERAERGVFDRFTERNHAVRTVGNVVERRHDKVVVDAGAGIFARIGSDPGPRGDAVGPDRQVDRLEVQVPVFVKLGSRDEIVSLHPDDRVFGVKLAERVVDVEGFPLENAAAGKLPIVIFPDVGGRPVGADVPGDDRVGHRRVGNVVHIRIAAGGTRSDEEIVAVVNRPRARVRDDRAVGQIEGSPQIEKDATPTACIPVEVAVRRGNRRSGTLPVDKGESTVNRFVAVDTAVVQRKPAENMEGAAILAGVAVDFAVVDRHRTVVRNLTDAAGASFDRCAGLPTAEVYEIFRDKFGDYLGKQDVLVALLCSMLNKQQKITVVNMQKFGRFAVKAKKRIAELEASLKDRN